MISGFKTSGELRPLALVILSYLYIGGCTNQEAHLSSYDDLDLSAQEKVDRAVGKYIRCTAETSIRIDDGVRHVGRLAWTATEICDEHKQLIIQKMSEEGVTYDASIIHASDSQVSATAAGINAIQTSRGSKPD